MNVELCKNCKCGYVTYEFQPTQLHIYCNEINSMRGFLITFIEYEDKEKYLDDEGKYDFDKIFKEVKCNPRCLCYPEQQLYELNNIEIEIDK